MKARKRDKRSTGVFIESQDDAAYLTGQRSRTEEEKQIRTPNPRRTGQGRGGRSKENEEEQS